MRKYIRIGVDIAKNSFQVHAVESEDCSATKRKLSRSGIVKFLADVEPCAIGMEACGSAHYWARQFRAMGHEVKLTPPIHVKAYVKRGKNDAADAAAICEAMSRPNMRFVAVKSEDQQATLMAHKTRELLIKQRTMSVNAKAHCATGWPRSERANRPRSWPWRWPTSLPGSSGRSSPPARPSAAPFTLRPRPIRGNALERRTQAQEFGERDDDVMNDTARRSKTIGHSAMGQEPRARPLDPEPRVVGLHQGQRTQSAPTGRTYDRRPPAVHRRNKNACQGAVHI